MRVTHIDRGVGLSDATASVGAKVLLDDGYRYVTAIDPPSTAFDGQGHLNNAAVSLIFNDLRIAYMITTHPELGADLGANGYVVTVRETHTLFESEGMPGDRFVGGVRIEGRRGRAQIIEQRLVEASTGRPVARAWLVLLLLRDDAVVDWPEGYWATVAKKGIPCRHTPARSPRHLGHLLQKVTEPTHRAPRCSALSQATCKADALRLPDWVATAHADVPLCAF